MARPRAPLGDANSLASFCAESERRTRPNQRKRVQVVRLAFDGLMPLDEIAREVGLARSTVQVFLDAYRAKGVSGLLAPLAKRGRPRIPESIRRAISEGLKARTWTGIRGVLRFAQDNGAPISRAFAYRLAGGAKWARKESRRKPAVRAEEQRDLFGGWVPAEPVPPERGSKLN